MFPETITITIDSQAKALNRINQDGYSSEYFLRETEGEFRLRIRNTSYNDRQRGSVKVDRHNVELIHTVYAVAPAVHNTVRKIYTVFENEQSDPIAAVGKFAVGGVAFLTAANITKMLNWES